MTQKYFCPRCRSEKVTDGSSRVITVLGIIVVGIAMFILFSSGSAHQIADWANFVPLEGHDSRALLVMALGLILIVGGAGHAEKLFCEACGYTWERATHPKATLHPSNRAGRR